jgi:uncharacterized protein YceH (UPF0502 family)
VDADAVEIRVLGCLIEKQRTTPDAYPLTLNALRLACNQTTNRDPVVHYDEPTIRGGIERLQRKGWARLASGPGSRAIKYRHLLDDALHLDGGEISLLGVLMLRGPQTLGELKARTDRMHRFESVAQVEETLRALIEREYVERLPRRPGEREERYRQLLGEDAEQTQTPALASSTEPQASVSAGLEERVRRLEETVESLVDALESMRRER